MLKLEPMLQAKARENQVANLKRGAAVPDKCPKRDSISTRAELARTAGVSRRLIDEGKLVSEHADAETLETRPTVRLNAQT